MVGNQKLPKLKHKEKKYFFLKKLGSFKGCRMIYNLTYVTEIREGEESQGSEQNQYLKQITGDF